MRLGELRVGLGALLRPLLGLNSLEVGLCLGLGLKRPRMGDRLSGLLSVLSLELVL